MFAAEETLQRNNKLMCMTATTQGIQCLLYKLLSTWLLDKTVLLFFFFASIKNLSGKLSNFEQMS